MADNQSMSLREAVGRVMCDEHADVLREGVMLVVREVMEAEVAELAGPRAGMSAVRIGWPTATATAAGSGIRVSARSSFRSPVFVRAATCRVSSSRAGAAAGPHRRGAGGVCQRGVDEEGGAARRAARGRVDEQGPGLQVVRSARRAGTGVSGAAVGGSLPVPVAGREGRAGPRPGGVHRRPW